MPTSSPDTSPMQYSMQQLMVAVTMLCVMASLIAWDPLWGVVIAAGSVALTLGAVGVWQRRAKMVWLAIAMSLPPIAMLIAGMANSIVWIGSHRLEVYVRAVDADTLQPVAGAKVEALDGPRLTWEGSWSLQPLQFTPARMEPGVGPLFADDHGMCHFPHRFRAYGSDTLFGDSGVVHTDEVWARVSAAGRASILLPTVGPVRDIHRTDPVCVVAPLRKQRAE